MPLAMNSLGSGRDAQAPQRRGTPPGSMRYYAVLFAAERARPLMHAFYALEAELRDSVASATHDIAHTRLQWWREELERFARGEARHPVTMTLAAAPYHAIVDLGGLRELAHAAALELACYRYADWSELESHSRRAGGTLQLAIAATLAAPAALADPEREFALRLGAAVRQTEMLRDFALDLSRGRLYVPLQALAEAGIDAREALAKLEDPALRSVLAAWRERVAGELDELPALLDPQQRRRQTHGLVLAALHRRLLDRMTGGELSAARRAELPPVARLWTAWRTAVASHHA
jgi:15-cis-phytoene synthase